MRYKIGITEAGDAGIDLSWEPKLKNVDGAILITKDISPAFHNAVLRHKEKVIVHATVTGWGGTEMEPGVPDVKYQLKAVKNLVAAGFPRDRIVIRVDPLIPTEGVGLSLAFHVMQTFIQAGFRRFRVSVVDMYPHARLRFEMAGCPLPYGNYFQPSAKNLMAAGNMLQSVKDYYEAVASDDEPLRIEACAEPGLKNVIHCGCISSYDLDLLGLVDNDALFSGFQRKGCSCYDGKTELLMNKERCLHGCLYCYWRD